MKIGNLPRFDHHDLAKDNKNFGGEIFEEKEIQKTGSTSSDSFWKKNWDGHFISIKKHKIRKHVKIASVKRSIIYKFVSILLFLKFCDLSHYVRVQII